LKTAQGKILGRPAADAERNCTLLSVNESKSPGDIELANESKLQLKEQVRPTRCESFSLLPFLRATLLRYGIM